MIREKKGTGRVATPQPTSQRSVSLPASLRFRVRSKGWGIQVPTLTGPLSPGQQNRKLLQRHSSGEGTSLRFAGLRWM